MLDLAQGKLSREERISIEVPLPADEKHMPHTLFSDGFQNDA